MQANPDLNYALGRDINAGPRGWGETLRDSYYESFEESQKYFFAGFKSFDKTGDFEGLGHKITSFHGNLFSNYSNGTISNLLFISLEERTSNARGMLSSSMSNVKILNLELNSRLNLFIEDGNMDPTYASDVGAIAYEANNTMVYFSKSNVEIKGRSNLEAFWNRY